MMPNNLCVLEKEEKKKTGGTDMVLGDWLCVQDLLSDPSCILVSELCSKTEAFPPNLCPKYHREHVGSISHGL